MDRLILSGATLIYGTGAEPVKGRAVVVEAGRISAVVPEGRHQADTTVLHLDGLTLLPGMINCHVHLCLGGEADPMKVLSEEPPAMTAIKAALRARQTVEAGVTTARDLGGRDGIALVVRDAVRAGLIAGPRILAAARGICMTGGHGWRFGREADGPDDVRKAVREQLKAGADVIKLLATGGVMTPGVEPGSPQLTPEEIRAAIEEARKAGRRTAAHAQAAEGIAACVEAGITSIEHGIFLTESVAQKMARDGIALVATLIAPEQIVNHGVAAGIPEFAVRKSEAVRGRHVESFQLAMRLGVPIAAGTDAGTPLNPHGSIVPELSLMVKAGMSPLDVVSSATSVAARVLGLENEIGRIAPGLAADLIAVGGNPGERLEALDDVRLVIANGNIVVNRLEGAGR
jgi:imidazolonepropionase-like amidohydrolase